MTLRDERGVSISAARTATVEHYERALGLFHGYYADPLAAIDRALADEPDFLMGHAFRAGLFVVSSEKRALGALGETVSRAKALIARGIGTERERAHVAAAEAWLGGAFEAACTAYNRLALEYPRDAFAVQVAHLCNFYLGRTSWLRDHVAAVLPHYGPADFSTSYLLGMHAFGLEENHQFERAEQVALRALDSNRRDPWAVHALAHVHEMRGEPVLNIQSLRARVDDWASENLFAIHNWWHLALSTLEIGDPDAVLDIYDRQIRASKSEVNLDLVDASALLWRLELRSIDVGDRFVELAHAWRRVEEEEFYAFNDVHALMAYAGAGSEADVARVLASTTRTARGSSDNAVITREVGLPACRGLVAFARGEYAATVDALFPIRPYAHRFGGSNAQRDLLDWTLIEAATRAGQRSLAEALINARAAERPRAISPVRMRLELERAASVPRRDTRAA
ncbi:MAG TPA: tetratricopeptide repeat protein [Polyangiaceae bacterium]